jgi:hypothetical protein
VDVSKRSTPSFLLNILAIKHQGRGPVSSGLSLELFLVCDQLPTIFIPVIFIPTVATASLEILFGDVLPVGLPKVPATTMITTTLSTAILSAHRFWGSMVFSNGRTILLTLRPHSSLRLPLRPLLLRRTIRSIISLLLTLRTILAILLWTSLTNLDNPPLKFLTIELQSILNPFLAVHLNEPEAS